MLNLLAKKTILINGLTKALTFSSSSSAGSHHHPETIDREKIILRN
jgi:hypothetical protein